MKKFDFKKILPHVIAIVVFFILAAIYFAPAVFDGKALRQGDVVNFTAMGRDLAEYHEETGEYAYWTNSVFGGMPCNYYYVPPTNNIFQQIGGALSLGFTDFNFIVVLLYLIGFYVGMLCFGVGPWLSMLAAIAYGFASYNIIIIEAGHINKALVMATMLPILGGIYLCYKRKYIIGSIVTLLSVGVNIYWSHQQITYYLLLIIIPLAIVYFIFAIKEKEVKHYFISSAILIFLAIFAIMPSASKLLPNMDYAQETMRGGAVLNKDDGQQKSSGLDIDYAYQWSYGIGESLTVLVPNLYGANSHYELDEDSETYKTLRPYGAGQASQICKYMPTYWGDQPFTSGPVYFGAIICFLFVLGLIICKGPERWWILAATIISFIMAWGRNLPFINNFLFYHLPLYSKFRVPAMSLVIANVTMILMAVLALNKFIKSENKQQYLKPLYISAGIVGGISLFLVLFGGMIFSFTGPSDNQLPHELRALVQDALIADRKSMLRVDAWRSFLFILAAFVVLLIYAKKQFNKQACIAILAVLVLVDLWTVDKRFLNDEHFVTKKEATEFKPTACDLQILQDKDPNYRVLNLSVNTFNDATTSYNHKSIGGYSPVKLRRYQDIIDYHLSGRNINMKVLNMLNTKYVIVPTQNGPQYQQNPDALGNVWFVNDVRWMENPNEEIEALNTIDPATTAVIDKEWQSTIEIDPQVTQADSAAVIRMSNYVSPGEIEYQYTSTKPRFAVFSEVYYKTWKAYVDGEEIPLVRTDYILRGAQLPAGKHTVVLKCHDDLFDISGTISLVSSIIVSLLLLSLIGLGIYKKVKE